MTQFSKTHTKTQAKAQPQKFGRYLLNTALTAAALASYSGAALADGPWTQWDNQNNFNVSSDGTHTTITTNAHIAGGNSPNLDILEHQSVNVQQSSSNGLFYGRAADDADPTRILGTLKSNGRILVIDRNGVFFGQNAVVDVNGIIATTGDISDEEIRSKEFGQYTIDNVTTGSIEMHGQITVAEAGLAAFVAPTVKNNGVINAKLGKVAFASGEKVTLDLYGDNLVEIEVAGQNADALIENTGTIAAEGGHIQMSAAAAKQAVDNIINVEGVVTASSATQQGGKIVLSGGPQGTVKVAGKVEANGATGGGKIDARGESVIVADTGSLNADATDNGNGGDIYIIAEKKAVLAGSATAKGGTNGGNGGFVELSSDDEFGITGTVDTTAAQGLRGTFLLDPRDLVLRVGTRSGLDLNNLYESDIEFLSNFTDIDLEARRNFTVASNTYGASDGVITLADGSSLTIRTTNEPLMLGPITIEGNNNGRIDLTGNAAYGANLEFKTSGTGSINILGATANNQSSNIILSKLTTESGNINVNTNNGSITWSGDVTTQNGNVTGTATGQNYIGATIATNGGDVALSGGGANFWDTGILLAHNGVIDTDGGAIDLTANNTKLVINGKALAGSGNLSLKAPVSGRIEFWGAGELQGDVVDLQSGLGVTQGALGSITANLLTGDVNQGVELSGQNNIKEIGDFETGSASHVGGFVLNNVSGATMKVAGDLSTQGGDVSLTNNARADVKSGGSVVTNGGDLVINANNNSFLYIDGIVNTGAGNTTLNAGSTIVMRTGDVTTGTLTTTGKVVEQWATSVIKANLLEGSLTKQAAFLGTNNDIVAIGNFSTGVAGTYAGGFTLVDHNGVQVAGTLSTQGGAVDIDSRGTTWMHYLDIANTGSILSNGGDVKLASHTGGLIVKGNINAGTGDIDLSGQQVQLKYASVVNGDSVVFTAGRVYQDTTSRLLANAISGVVQSDVVLQGANNDVAQIGNFTTGAGNWHNGGFTLVDVNGFDVVGALSSDGGDIILRSKGTVFNESIDVLSGASIVSGGGDITLDSNGTGGGFTTVAGTVNAGAGDVSVNARQFRMSGAGFVTADELAITAGSITQAASSRIVANRLSGTTSASAFFDGVNNDIVTLGNFATGASNWSNGQFRLVDTNGLTVDGIVSTYGTTRNPLYGDGSVSITTTGGDLNFAGTSGVITNGGSLAVKSDTLIDVDHGANIALGNGAAHFDAPNVNLGDDIGTTGPITGTASLVYVENPDAQIQDGLDVAAAGATVNVLNGVYTENVIIEKAVKLVGESLATIVQYDAANAGRGVAGNLITVTAENVNIDPFTFDGLNIASYGVNAVAGSHNLVVDGNTFRNFLADAINVEDSNNILLIGNVIYNVGGDAIEIVRGANAEILGNFIGYTDAGVTVGAVDNIGGDGIKVDGNNGVIIKGNYVTQTRGAGAADDVGSGIFVRNVSGATIGGTAAGEANILSNIGWDGIKLENSSAVEVRGNTIENVERVGIYAGTVNGAVIAANILRNANLTLGDYGAISADFGSNLNIQGNDIDGSAGHGIKLANGIGGTNTVAGNYIDGVNADGVNASSVSALTVRGNFIGQNDVIGRDGVSIASSNSADVDGNRISSFARNGVEVQSSVDVRVRNNVIEDGQKGVNANAARNIQINDNTITDASIAGIYVTNSDGTDYNNDVDIWKNTITLNNVTADGIVVLNSNYATIGVDNNNPFAPKSLAGGNKITGGRNGIVVDESDKSLVVFNTVLNSNEDGIYVTNSDDIVIRNNLVEDAGEHGIHAVGYLAGDDDAIIRNNTVNRTGSHGILANRFDDLSITGNTVNDAGEDGIHALRTLDLVVTDNTVTNSVDTGIYVDGYNDEGRGHTVLINENTITDSGEDGVYIVYTDKFDIVKNTITNSANNGIAAYFYDFGLVNEGNIDENIIDTAGSDGIYANGLAFLLDITNNTITDAAIHGIHFSESLLANVTGNTVNDGSEIGILAEAVDLADISNNTVTGASFAGINVLDSNIVNIADNTVQNGDLYGVFVEGTGNSNITLAGNDLLNNPVGARFESGMIDISNLANPNNIVNTLGGTPVGLQFDGDPSLLRIAGQTIGATTFSGFANIGSFYVRFEDGSILDPVTGAPLLINGLNASYDGFVPPADGILTQDILDYLEARIYDADDVTVNGRGQLFVGYVPQALGFTIDNIEDFFNSYGAFLGNSGNISVTIASMPFIQQTPAAPSVAPALPNSTLSIQNLANIEPAAGEEAGAAQQAPANVADIEPAAGGEASASESNEEVNCWGDAANSAASGRAASYTFGSAFGESSIAEVAGCNTASAL